MVEADVVSAAPVGGAMVSFNTLSVTSQAIYALFRYIRRPEFRLVVVDNASTDGSAEMLAALASAGLCEVVLNAEQRYHGPGLNQGIDHHPPYPVRVYDLLTDRYGRLIDQPWSRVRFDIVLAKRHTSLAN